MSKAELNRAELSKVEETGFLRRVRGQFVPEGLKQALDYLAKPHRGKNDLSFAKS